jgi:trigger factor
MPGQQQQIIEYYTKNPSAATSLRGSIYEEKIINLIKVKSKKIKKIIGTKEAEALIKNHHKSHDHSHNDSTVKKSKKLKKSVKPSPKNKKIRKK